MVSYSTLLIKFVAALLRKYATVGICSRHSSIAPTVNIKALLPLRNRVEKLISVYIGILTVTKPKSRSLCLLRYFTLSRIDGAEGLLFLIVCHQAMFLVLLTVCRLTKQ